MRRKTNGFTLIELLVVIAIIAILAAILFPVFAKAREKARQSACLSNMKQMGLGVMMYKDDNDQTYPPVVVFEDTAWTGPTGNLMGSDTGFWDHAWGWQQLIYPYTKNMSICRCPSSSSKGTNATEAVGKRNYGANVSILGYDPNYYPTYTNSPYNMGIKNDAVVNNPASKYMIMDYGMYQASWIMTYHPFLTNYLPGSGKYAGSDIVDTSWQSGSYAITSESKSDYMNARHNGGVSVSFADGHAAWKNVQEVCQGAYDRAHSIVPDPWDPLTADK